MWPLNNETSFRNVLRLLFSLQWQQTVFSVRKGTEVLYVIQLNVKNSKFNSNALCISFSARSNSPIPTTTPPLLRNALSCLQHTFNGRTSGHRLITFRAVSFVCSACHYTSSLLFVLLFFAEFSKS